MEVEFDVKIGFWNLYDFLLARTYLSFQGILGTIAGAFFIVEFCIEPRVIFLVAGLLILLYIPIDLFFRTKTMLMQSVYKKPLHYKLSDEGIEVSQEGAEGSTSPWEALFKAGSTLGSILLYTTKKTAVILPKSQLEKQNVRDKVMEIVSTHMSPSKVNMR